MFIMIAETIKTAIISHLAPVYDVLRADTAKVEFL